MTEYPHLDQGKPAPARPSVAKLPGLLILVAALVFFLYARHTQQSASPSAAHMPFGSSEQQVAAQIKIANMELSRAENFLHQEVTTLAGEVTNAGGIPLRGLELSVEFSDSVPEIILRERRAVIAPPGPPLQPGETRNFEIAFERVPSSWNNQAPVVRIAGLLAGPPKQ